MKNSTKKNLSTLVEDIYQTVTDITDGKRKIPDELVDELGQKIARTIKTWATPQNHNKFKLRMSNIGRPARQLYYSQKDNREIRHHPSTQMKFLYGHIMEDLLIFLTKLSGHEVTDEQKEVKVKGVVGHMDCKIDGEVIDIKTASGFGFKKFKNGTLRDDDPFGYISQLAGYERAEGTENGGFLAMNKESGEIALYQPDDLDKPNIKTLIGKLLDVLLNLGKPPEKCYKPVPAGIKGNMKLPIGCVYCSHKIECNKDTNDGQGLRMFKYAKGITYLTKVVSTPNVEEITNAKTYH
jgi:plasmid maintenance system antidote protein VapI